MPPLHICTLTKIRPQSIVKLQCLERFHFLLLALECEKRQRLELELKRLQQAQGKPAAKPVTEN